MPDRAFDPLIRYAPYANALDGAPRPKLIGEFVHKPFAVDTGLSIRGTVTRDGIPVMAMVYLLSTRSMSPINAMRSGHDGGYAFRSLTAIDGGYTVIGFDPLGTFDPEAKTGLQPTPDP